VSVDDPTGWLVRVVTRLCIDRLRARKGEAYDGPWLPDPLVERPADVMERVEEISYAFLLALERLSPLERAVFLLHEVFDRDYGEIAAILERSEDACRQLASRAKAHVRAGEPRVDVGSDEAARLSGAFFSAIATGDLEGLLRVLTPDAVLFSDGGGKRRAARKPISGADRVARFFIGVNKRGFAAVPASMEAVRINGLPGFMVQEHDGRRSTIAFDVREGRIAAIYAVLNPDKTAHLGADLRGTEG